MSGDRTDTELFDAYYFSHGGGRPYQRDKEWLNFFASIADRIFSDIEPKTVLDARCAMGFLVEALRERGVEAYGIDISEYAIDRVHEDVKEYCWVGSVTDPLPRSYDLIVCIEVFEHLHPREAEEAVENICQHTDDILFSSTPFDFKEATHFNLQPPDYWVELFARRGFYRDVEFDATFIAPWTVRFRRLRGSTGRVIASYERRLWRLEQENQARREFAIEQKNELARHDQLGEQLAEKEERIRALQDQLHGWEVRWADLQMSLGWAALEKSRNWRLRLAPRGSQRERMLQPVFRGLRLLIRQGFGVFLRSLYQKTFQPLITLFNNIRFWAAGRRMIGQAIEIEEIEFRSPVISHTVTVDIIICVHNALPDVTTCLEAIVRHTSSPYSIALVDDGSDAPTQSFLASFAAREGTELIRNEEAKGYTCAANQGLRHASAEFIVLLNSDTVVTSGWLDRLLACAESNPKVGVVGPLSNTASWQSIPEIESEGDWALNPLREGMTIEKMGDLVANYSARLYPEMPLLNGFCLLIRQQVIQDIGIFDEKTFGGGFGEEDDYILRARKAGWLAALADDVYVHHAQSRSYTRERRKRLTERAGPALAKKHGQNVVDKAVEFCYQNRVLEGIRARSKVMFARQEWISKGQEAFAGRRVLFVLPIAAPGGGGNVVVREAMAMRAMGVEVTIFNFKGLKERFEGAYPQLDIPVVYGEKEQIQMLARDYDAVIATFNPSVEWLKPIVQQNGLPVRGYYIQGFEPYIYQPGSEGFQRAWESYSLFPDLVRFAKTEWTQKEVLGKIGVDSAVVGVDIDIDLFRPRPSLGLEWPDRPLRVAAMIRPSSPYREPALTMELLKEASRHYGMDVEILIFGISLNDPEFVNLPTDFHWKLAGVLHQKQVAAFLNEVEIFTDFSSHQAMGLTALEAMACGAAVIVPSLGGATSYARDEENSLVVDTTSRDACWRALQRLIEDHDLRKRLQRNAIFDVCDLFPEKPAFNVLNALFG